MTKIIVKSGVIDHKKFIVNKQVEKLIEELADKYGLTQEQLVERALNNNYLELHSNEVHSNEEEVSKLQNELLDVQKKMFSVEMKWSSLHTRNLLITRELKELSVSLIGFVNQNRTLRKMLGMEEKYDEMRKLAEHYLFMNYRKEHRKK